MQLTSWGDILLKQTDAQLVERALAGDDAAFDELVSRYRVRVYNLALSMVRSRETALDLAQDVFVRAYMSLGTLKEPERFRAWLTGIAANVCKMHLRKPREVAVSSEVMEQLSGSVNPISDTDADLARQLIDALPNGTRSAAVLYFVEGMKQVEIAEFLGISISAVKARIRDAKMRLQKEMIHMTKRAVKREEPGDEFNRSLKQKLELARYYREFSEMIDYGTSLVRALHILRDGSYSAPIKQATSEVIDAVMSGSTLSSALEKQPVLLTPETVPLVKAGEFGGFLHWTASILANWLDVQNTQRDIELSFWCRTLGSMLVGNMSFRETLAVGAKIAQDSRLRSIMEELERAADGEEPLGLVIQKYPDVFPPVFQLAVLAGMHSGELGYALLWAADEIADDVSQRVNAGEKISIDLHSSNMNDGLKSAMINYLGYDSPAIRAAAARALGRLKVKEAGADISVLFADDDAQVRKAAIQAVVDLDFKIASEELAICMTDTERLVRYSAVRAIRDLQLRDGVPALVAAVADPDLVVSSLAADALVSFGDPAILAQYARDLLPYTYGFECIVRNSDSGVVSVLLKIQQPTLDLLDRNEMLAVMKEDPDLRLAWLAALALAEMGRGEGIPILLVALGLDDEWVVRKTAFALGRLDRKEAVPRLIEQLYYPHQCGIQRDAAQILAGLGDPSAAQHIRNSIEKGLLGPEFVLLAQRLENQ